MNWKYGDSWEEFPMKSGDIWEEKNTGSSYAVGDIFEKLPMFMTEADMIYCDPPWNLGNVNSFITKNNSSNYVNGFKTFYDRLFFQIGIIRPAVCYLEIGKKHLEDFQREMNERFPVVQTWQVTYYKKNVSYLIRGGNIATTFDFTGKDDGETPLLAIKEENPFCVADLCTGRGLTAVSAFVAGKKFVGIELNQRRMAVTLDKISKKGGEICLAK